MFSPKIKGASTHIVLANNNAEECKLFKVAVNTLGIQCNLSVIENGAELLKLLSQATFTPDIIFWDKEVPCIEANCFDLIIRKIKFRSIPVIVFSKSQNARNKDYCYNTRANEYFLRALSFLL